MKIAIIAHAHHPITQPYTGGLEAHTHQLAQELMRQGHKVTLFAKAGSDKSLHLIPIFWGNAMDGKHPLYNNGYHVTMLRIVMGNYDLIINNSLNHVPLQLHDKAFPPMITIFHTPPLQKLTSVLKSKGEVENRSYIAVSEFTAKQWQKYVPEPIKVVPNGMALSNWVYRTQSPSNRSATWVGRITPEKGTHIALQACINLGLPITLGGPIYDKAYYKDMIKPLCKNNLVTYVGHISQKEINRLHTKSSVALVTPVWDEPFGLVAIEALASGTPVAALSHGGLTNIIKHNVGALSESDSVEDFERAIQQALRKDRQTCRDYVEDKYSLSDMAEAYIASAPVATPNHYFDESFTWQI